MSELSDTLQEVFGKTAQDDAKRIVEECTEKRSDEMSEIQKLKNAIAILTTQIDTMSGQRSKIEYKLRTLESQEFIRVNRITKDDVELSEFTVTDRYWGHVNDFAGWLRVNSKKMFAEWNGELHFQSDLKQGYFKPTAGRWEDVEK